MGEHGGAAFYTLGQRKGLGFTVGKPMFVIEIDTARNLLIVGEAVELERHDFIVEDVKLVYGEMASRTCGVQIRAHGNAPPATLTPLPNGTIHVQYETPQRAISPGQAAVFYAGDRVLGGGRITLGQP